MAETTTRELTKMLGLDNPIHIAFLLILLLLVFGAKRLPEMGRSLGAGMRGFKDSLTGESAEPAPIAEPAATMAVSPAPAVASVPPAPVAVASVPPAPVAVAPAIATGEPQAPSAA
jgi:sec-independent protein translocase protein TatA